jgi:HlyD family secretion protein
VLELMVERGDVVTPGSPILSVEVQSEELMAVLFVPASDGKRVQVGMAARVSPSTVKKEEFGYLLGRVTWVAAFPSTSRGMVHLLGNEALVTKLMQDGPPIQVDVALERAPRTPTGYRWSSSRGPEGRISSGTLADGSVVVREDRPVSLVLPAVREKLGI